MPGGARHEHEEHPRRYGEGRAVAEFIRGGDLMSTARAISRPNTGQRRSPVLRLIPGGISTPPKAPFGALVVTVLAVGWWGLLVLNTALRQGAIELSEAEAENARLRDDVTALSEEVANREASGSLATAAEDLGMVPVEDPEFLHVGSDADRARPGDDGVEADGAQGEMEQGEDDGGGGSADGSGQ